MSACVCLHQGSVRIFAKDLVRTKKSIQKFHQMGAQLRALEIRITVLWLGGRMCKANSRLACSLTHCCVGACHAQTIQSTHAMSEALKGAVKSMVRMNKQLKLPQLQVRLHTPARWLIRRDLSTMLVSIAVFNWCWCWRWCLTRCCGRRWRCPGHHEGICDRVGAEGDDGGDDE